MHILFLSDNFPPEVNAPASRTFEHCREWVKAGHQVTVVTCAPNFPKGIIFIGYQNSLWQSEIIDGIRVIRVWTYISANEGFAKRVLDYLSFMVSGTIATFFIRNVDIVVGTSPQFFTVCSAWVVASFKRVPWVFELRDIWPESIKAVGAMKDSLAIRLLERLAMFLYRKADLMVVVTHSFRRILVNSGIDINKIIVITNGVDLSRFALQDKDVELVRQYKLSGKFVVGYIGTHGMAHSLESILNAAELLNKDNETKDIQFIFLGDGAKKGELVVSAKKRGLDNVIFLESVQKEEVPKYWSLLDISVIHLRKSHLFSQVIPSKLFECMGMGIPVLHGVAGESAAIVETEKVGVVFESENYEQLAQELVKLRNDKARYQQYRENGLNAARHYDRVYLANEMLNAFLQLKNT